MCPHLAAPPPFHAAQAIGDDLIDSIVGDNIPILTGEEKYNESVSSSVSRVVAKLTGKEDPGPPFRSALLLMMMIAAAAAGAGSQEMGVCLASLLGVVGPVGWHDAVLPIAAHYHLLPAHAHADKLLGTALASSPAAPRPTASARTRPRRRLMPRSPSPPPLCSRCSSSRWWCPCCSTGVRRGDKGALARRRDYVTSND